MRESASLTTRRALNLGNNALSIFHYVIITESNHLMPIRHQPFCAPIIIVFGMVMTRPIEFNDQPGLRAIKIRNEPPYRMLPSEFETRFAASQMKPQHTFRRRWLVTHFSGAPCDYWRMVMTRFAGFAHFYS